MLPLCFVVTIMWIFECRWLVKKHRNDKALRVLSRVRCSAEEQVREEFNEILSATKNGSEAGFRNSLKLLIQWKVLQRYICNYNNMSAMRMIILYTHVQGVNWCGTAAIPAVYGYECYHVSMGMIVHTLTVAPILHTTHCAVAIGTTPLPFSARLV